MIIRRRSNYPTRRLRGERPHERPPSLKVFGRSVGHRQVTDAYLLSLAQHHKGKLATFDGGIAELIPGIKERHQHITLIEA